MLENSYAIPPDPEDIEREEGLPGKAEEVEDEPEEVEEGLNGDEEEIDDEE